MNKWCFKDLDCIFQDDLIQVCISSLGMSLLELRKRSLGRAACTSCVPQFCVNQVISLAYLSLSALLPVGFTVYTEVPDGRYLLLHMLAQKSSCYWTTEFVWCVCLIYLPE